MENDSKYNNYIKDIKNTFAPLNLILKLFSLNSHRQKYTHPWQEVMKRSIPVVIIGSINLFTLYYKMEYFYKTILVSVMYTDMIQMIYDIGQYTVDVFFVYKYGAEYCYEYTKQYASIDRLIGTDGLYLKIRLRLIKVMVLLIIAWFLSTIFDYVIWVNGFGFIQTTIYSISYVYIFIKILSNLDLTANVIHVESRLLILGDIIQDYYASARDSPEAFDDIVAKKKWFYNDGRDTIFFNKGLLRPVKRTSGINRQEVKWLSSCYLLLIEQTKFINRMYGMRMLLNSTSLLIDIIRFTNLAILVLLGSQDSGYASGYYPAIANLSRSLTCVIVLISLVDHCERVYKQRETILLLLDHLIVDKTLDDEMLLAFNNFKILVQSQVINFQLYDFMRLDYTLLVSIASVVVTYTIILLQSQTIVNVHGAPNMDNGTAL